MLQPIYVTIKLGSHHRKVLASSKDMRRGMGWTMMKQLLIKRMTSRLGLTLKIPIMIRRLIKRAVLIRGCNQSRGERRTSTIKPGMTQITRDKMRL